MEIKAMSRRSLWLAASVLAGVGMFASGAMAQQSAPDAQVEEVVVTGSRVAVSDATSTSPISVVTAETMKDTGLLSMADILRRDPAASNAGRGQSATLNGGGAVGINLRNLGNNRTLILVNGRRYAGFSDELGNSTQDLSLIPSGMVERVDILRDGASTAYGADAVSGVANFILRDRFDGAEFTAQYGISDENDAASYRFGATVGAANDRGSVLLSAQYQKQDLLRQNTRAWATRIPQSLAGSGTFGQGITPWGAVFGGSTKLACYGPGSTANLITTGCPVYDSSPESTLVLGVRVKSIGGALRYDLTDSVRFKATGFYSQRNSLQHISANQINTTTLTGPFATGFTVGATETNNPFGRAVGIQWRSTAYGEASNRVDAKELWGTAGFSGTIFDRFDWEVAATYSQTNTASDRLNNVNTPNFRTILNPSLCAADVSCSKVGAITDLVGFLTNTKLLTADQRNYLFFTAQVPIKITSEQQTATIAGPLFDLPAGEVKAALGFEHRVEHSNIQPDALTIAGFGRSQVFPTDGEYSTKEAFGEVQVPLLADAPFAKNLDLNVQLRYSDFSNFGGATTYKVGLNWAVTDDVRIRSSYGSSYRAPTVIELYGGGVGAVNVASDPCNASGIRATNATVAANCTRLGVPANYAQPVTALPGRSGGNPNLEPEEGRTLTVGAVITPRFLPDLTVTIDYYDFIIHKTIGGNNLTTLLAGCYADPNLVTRAADASDICFGTASRSGTTGDIGRVNTGRLNLPGSTVTSGVDFSARYNVRELGPVPGSLSPWLQGNYLGVYKTTSGATQQRLQGFFSSADAAYPRWQVNFGLDYTLDAWKVSWLTQYISGMKDFSTTSFPANNYLGYSGTPDYYVSNLVVKWKAPSDIDLTAGMNNVFDKKPPFAFITTRGSLYMYDQVGRYLFVSASKRF